MEKTIHIAECQEPWIYWWELLRSAEQDQMASKYFGRPSAGFFGVLVTPNEVRHIWASEGINPLEDYDWIELADTTFRDRDRFNPEQQKEIWRQVYRIASDRI